MESGKLPQRPQVPASVGAMILPCDQKHFADFVSGLLGKPQTIAKRKPGVFDLGHEEIASFFHLVHQRVTQQNAGDLVQFTVKVIYNDGASVLHNSLDAFQTYNEVRPVWATEVILTWTYLITFQQKDVPEKQVIEVHFDTDRVPMFIVRDFGSSIDASVRMSSSVVGFRIMHTEWTWGADIEARLSAHTDTLLEREHPVKRWLRAHSGKIAFAFSMLVIIGAIASIYLSMHSFARYQAGVMASRDPGVAATAEVVLARLSQIQQSLAEGAWYRFTMTSFLLVSTSIVIALVGAALISSVVESSPPSFLRLTAQSEKHKAKSLRRARRQWLKFAASVVLSICASLAANFVYACLVKPPGQ